MLRAFLNRLDARLTTALTSRPRLTCLLAGFLTVFALPPFGFFPLLFITLPVLYRALQGITPKQGFVRGWCFSFGLLVGSLYWIAASMFVDLAAFWWAVPLAVAGLPLYLSLYSGFAGAAYTWLDRRFVLTPAAGVFTLAVLLSLADLARGTIFTGFPWVMLGQTWEYALPLLQSVSLIGIYGLTLLTLLLGLTPILLKYRQRATASAIILVTLLLTGWGTYRLATANDAMVDGVQLRLIQPNIPQSMKMDQSAHLRNFQHGLDLAALSAGVPPTHIIWPEAAVPFLLDQSEEQRLQIGARTPDNGLTIMGAPWRRFTEDGERLYSNSLVAIDSVGALQHQYDKSHLVPFGEYFPLRAVLKNWFGTSLNAIAAGAIDFTPGPGPQTLRLPGLPPFSPMICYEIIFSGEVTDPTDRAGWLLNVTNDAWFGTTTGPYQHFAIARLRAIEEGLPVIRVANTGISGVIDAYGRILGTTSLNTRTALDMGLPVSLPPTLFSKFHNISYLLLLVGCILAAFLLQRKRSV